MRCKYCNVEIGCKAKVCPLCHEKLEDDSDSVLPAAYPSKSRKKERKHLSASSLYLSIAVSIFVLSIPINLLTTPEVYWFGIVGILGVYGLVLVRNTILSNNSIGVKIFWQCLWALVVLLVVNVILSRQIPELTGAWVWNYGLPTILLSSTLVVGIYTAIAFRFWNDVIVDAMCVSAVGFVPVILYAFKVITHPAMSITCACVSSVVIIFCGILGRKSLVAEFRKRFHV